MNEAERAHQLLTVAAEPPGPQVTAPGPELVRRARRRRRARRQSAVAAVAVLAAGALVTPLALLRAGGESPPVAPLTAPSPPEPAEFGAAPPLLARPSGGVPKQQPFCQARDVQGDARLLPSRYGVLGAVRLRGDKCSLRADPASVTLLDRGGRPLDVPVRSEPSPNPGELIRPDKAQAAGDVAVGFTWRGSWCGPAVAQLRLAAVAGVTGARALVTVPVTGPSPACMAGEASSGYIVPGLVGHPGSPVQPAPPAWAALRATIRLPAFARGDQPVSYRVLLQNTGNRPVTLSPCPHYSRVVAGRVQASTHGAAGDLIAGDGGMLPCGRLLPPGGSLQVPLVLDASHGPFAPGVVRVEWAMAGVPTARGSLRIR